MTKEKELRLPLRAGGNWLVAACSLIRLSTFPVIPSWGVGVGGMPPQVCLCTLPTQPALLRDSALISHLPSITQQICVLNRTILYKT